MRLHGNLSKLHGAKLLSRLDVRSNYCNIILAKDSRKYNAFTTEYYKYEFLHVPFGIHIALSYCAVMISETVKGVDFCFTYLDIIIYSKSEKECFDNLQQVFEHLYKANPSLH